MSDLTEVTGMVISAMPVGEYDRRIVLLTKERGKISAFAKGARRPNSQLMGVTRAFVFGKFQLYEGKTSYNVRQADISNYFEEVISDLDAVCYGCYFAELADYYGRENLDASAMINLLYAALKALIRKEITNELVRYIYELKLIWMNGECPEFFQCNCCGSEENLSLYSSRSGSVYCEKCAALNEQEIQDGIQLQQSTFYTLQYIISVPTAKLFTFTVSDEVLRELKMVLGRIRAVTFDKHMKSEDMLNT